MKRDVLFIRIRIILGAVALLLFCAPQVSAHGEIHKLIKKISAEIENHPDSAFLYMKRGILYQKHGAFDEAMADFQKSKILDPEMDVADLRIGTLLASEGHFKSAFVFVNAFLDSHPENVTAIQARAGIHTGLGQDSLALLDRIAVLELANPLRPEFFIQTAKAQVRSQPENIEAALGWLDMGLEKMGFMITLIDFAVDLELSQAAFEKAVIRIQQVRAKYPRHERWTIRMAEVYAQMKDQPKAIESYELALKEIQQLPRRHRNTEVVQNEISLINSRLETLLSKN